MGAAFTDKESDAIRLALKEAACRFGNTLGVRKTTIEQLAESAGISKGAFYKFFASKELLFFELMEDGHTELYQVVWKKWKSCRQLPLPRRLAEAILEMMRMMDSGRIFGLHEDDLTYVLRKVPQEVIDKHYDSDEEHEAQLAKRMGLRLNCSMPEAIGVFRGLMLAFYRRKILGPRYRQALRILTEGACEKMVKP